MESRVAIYSSSKPAGKRYNRTICLFAMHVNKGAMDTRKKRLTILDEQVGTISLLGAYIDYGSHDTPTIRQVQIHLRCKLSGFVSTSGKNSVLL